MRAGLEAMRSDAVKAMKVVWYIVLFFTIIQFAVSVAVAQKNTTSPGGYKSATFAAIWAMFLTLIFVTQSAQVVFRGKCTKFEIGFLIGFSSMLSQLYFVLMCMFFVLGSEATGFGYGTAQADNAYGAFALFNTFVYMVYAIVMSVHRQSVSLDETTVAGSGQPAPYNDQEPVYKEDYAAADHGEMDSRDL